MANERKTHELTAEPRAITGKASSKVRRRGLVPGVVYGHNVKSQSVQVSKKELEHVYLRAGSTTLVDLTVGKGSTPEKVFIHDVQRDAVHHNLMHVDFMVVNLTEEMTVNVQIVLVGEAPAVANKEGLLLHQTEHVTIKALPANIPQLFEVDISSLDEVGKAVHVSDLEIPENVTLVTPEDELIAKIGDLPVMEVEEVEEEAEEAAEGAEGAGGEGEAESGESSETEDES